MWATLHHIIPDINLIPIIQGIIFVLGSGILIYFISSSYFQQLKKALKNSREYQVINEKILSSSSDGIGFVDEFGIFIINNQSLLEILNIQKSNSDNGFSIEEIDDIEIRTILNKFLKGQLKTEYFSLELKTGTWIKLILSRIFDFGDKPIVLLQCINISDQVSQEKNLQEIAQKCLSIFQKVPFGILLVDEAGNVKYNNEVSLKLIGAIISELNDFSWLNALHKEDRSLFETEWESSLTSNSDFKIRCRFVISNNSIAWRDIYSTQIKQYDQNVRLITIRDISDQVLLEQKIQENSDELKSKVKIRTSEIEQKSKRLEDSQKALTYLLEDVNEFREELELTNDLLASANSELEAFSYSVSHDLRAPLRSINGFSQALIEDYKSILDETGLDFLNRIRNGAIKMGKLIDDMLILSKISRKELKMNKVSISNIAHDVLDELSESEPDRIIECNIEDEIVCRGDANLLRILMSNLLGNAWKFTSRVDKAQITIGKDNKGVVFVSDNGVGFDIRYSGKIFEPFQRIHSSNDYKGTGVGLAIVKRIIQRHHGKIWVKSHVGRGATFYFSIR